MTQCDTELTSSKWADVDDSIILPRTCGSTTSGWLPPGGLTTDRSMYSYILAINLALRDRSISHTECRQWLIPPRSLASAATGDLPRWSDEGEREDVRWESDINVRALISWMIIDRQWLQCRSASFMNIRSHAILLTHRQSSAKFCGSVDVCLFVCV